MRTNRSWLCFFGAAFVCSLSASGHAEDGVSKDSILFGQVAALNGPAQALGQGMREGILAAFEEANRAGGINGRKLELKSIDDGYEPEKTIEATNKAIKEEKVFALVGAVGTPTSKAGQPIATAAKVPAAVLGAALVAWLYVGRSVARRLGFLSEAMRRLASGDVTVDIHDTRRDEIGDMGRTLLFFRQATADVASARRKESEQTRTLESRRQLVETATQEFERAVSNIVQTLDRSRGRTLPGAAARGVVAAASLQKFSSERGDRPPLRAHPYSSHR